ncbi:MAG: diguanylate cyclase [gamma proteobacterium endosymbiont of Lamellibrachia anaximandri]|nr:diguanylate cyclase [gamma proteobacterium endosymbiont of Lamellibrachia anaximandri]MBL3534927.1 diguanylate cyclase [gamma proteobacterium endosymbiont of Lamellibrachia anaximandri]
MKTDNNKKILLVLKRRAPVLVLLLVLSSVVLLWMDWQKQAVLDALQLRGVEFSRAVAQLVEEPMREKRDLDLQRFLGLANQTEPLYLAVLRPDQTILSHWTATRLSLTAPPAGITPGEAGVVVDRFSDPVTGEPYIRFLTPIPPEQRAAGSMPLGYVDLILSEAPALELARNSALSLAMIFLMAAGLTVAGSALLVRLIDWRVHQLPSVSLTRLGSAVSAIGEKSTGLETTVSESLDAEKLLILKNNFQGLRVGRLTQLIHTYLSSAETLLEKMEQTFDRRDARALFQLAHSLKSSSANLTALRLSNLCRNLEKEARDGKVLEGEKQLRAIRDEFSRVSQALEVVLTELPEDEPWQIDREQDSKLASPYLVGVDIAGQELVDGERRPRVMVVDDDSTEREMAKSLLQEGGFDVVLAENGRIALDRFFTDKPAVMLLNLEMPELDGLQVCERLRLLPGGEHLPVIMVTGHDDLPAIEKAYAVEATDFVTKPVVWAVLVQRIRYLLRAAAAFERVNELAISDALTGLPNRRHTLERMQQGLAEARRNNLTFSCTLVDIDYFKRINDTHGHLVGDIVLRELAGVLRMTARTYDVIGRIGGEEFLMFSIGLDIDAANQMAERLRHAVANHSFGTRNFNEQVTVSLGVTAASSRDESYEQLLKAADKALYAAKDRGRNCVASM